MVDHHPGPGPGPGSEVPTAPAAPFDIGELYRTLDELEGMCVELKYIDDALRYLREQEGAWWQGHGITDTGSVYVEREFGTTAPFTKRYHMPDSWRFFWQDSPADEADAHLTALAQEAETAVADDMASIRALIRPFTATMDGYDAHVLAPLASAHQMITDELYSDFGKLRQTIGDWEGPAAESFADRFYHPFEATLRSQRSVLSALHGAAASAKAITAATQHSIMTVVSSVRDQVHEQLQLRQHHADLVDQESQKSALIIASGVSTIVAAVVTGGLWGAALGTTAGLGSIASTGVPSEGTEPYLLAGSDYESLRDSLVDALRTIDHRDGAHHDELQGQVEDVLGRVEDLRHGPLGDDGRLIPISPDLVDGVDGSRFYLP